MSSPPNTNKNNNDLFASPPDGSVFVPSHILKGRSTSKDSLGQTPDAFNALNSTVSASGATSDQGEFGISQLNSGISGGGEFGGGVTCSSPFDLFAQEQNIAGQAAIAARTPDVWESDLMSIVELGGGIKKLNIAAAANQSESPGRKNLKKGRSPLGRSRSKDFSSSTPGQRRRASAAAVMNSSPFAAKTTDNIEDKTLLNMGNSPDLGAGEFGGRSSSKGGRRASTGNGGNNGSGSIMTAVNVHQFSQKLKRSISKDSKGSASGGNNPNEPSSSSTKPPGTAASQVSSAGAPPTRHMFGATSTNMSVAQHEAMSISTPITLLPMPGPAGGATTLLTSTGTTGTGTGLSRSGSKGTSGATAAATTGPSSVSGFVTGGSGWSKLKSVKRASAVFGSLLGRSGSKGTSGGNKGADPRGAGTGNKGGASPKRRNSKGKPKSKSKYATAVSPDIAAVDDEDDLPAQLGSSDEDITGVESDPETAAVLKRVKRNLRRRGKLVDQLSHDWDMDAIPGVDARKYGRLTGEVVRLLTFDGTGRKPGASGSKGQGGE